MHPPKPANEAPINQTKRITFSVSMELALGHVRGCPRWLAWPSELRLSEEKMKANHCHNDNREYANLGRGDSRSEQFVAG